MYAPKGASVRNVRPSSIRLFPSEKEEEEEVFLGVLVAVVKRVRPASSVERRGRGGSCAEKNGLAISGGCNNTGNPWERGGGEDIIIESLRVAGYIRR